jgi:hypothetical protein
MIKILGVNLMANFNNVDWMLICVVIFALREDPSADYGRL